MVLARAARVSLVLAAAYAVACGARSGLDVGGGTGAAGGSDASSPADAASPVGITRRTLSMSWDHACAITADGAVACWGSNATGLVADGAPLYAPPTRVPGLSGVIEVAVGQVVSCALLGEGTTWCWGDAVGSRAPTKMWTLPRATRLFAGAEDVCVITTEGFADCIGAPFWSAEACPVHALLDFSAGHYPQSVPNVAEVALGTSHACLLDATGSVWCWGCSDRGSLGSLSQPSTGAAVLVPGVTAAHIAAETGAVCALSRAGEATCWGDGSQFGTSLTTAPTAPRPVSFPRSVDLDVGVVFTCAAGTGEVTCKGALYDFGTGCGQHDVATRTFAIPGVREVSIGYRDACARDARGDVWCWGCNDSGATGDPTRAGHDTPSNVPL
jgi:alpha-tubulin suppressor-like RCC1 family protein